MEMKHTSLVVENLEVASNGRGNKSWIRVLKSYTREELPVDR